MLLEPLTAKLVILTLVHLHNLLRKNKSTTLYKPPGMVYVEYSDTGQIYPGLWRRNSSNTELIHFDRTARSSNATKQVRNEFSEHFMSPEGELYFQYKIS